jgi:hypothetical protein
MNTRVLGFGKTLFTVGLLSLPFQPVSATAGEANLRNYVEVFRSDVSTGKKAMLTEIMKLNEKDATAFWPLYRDYEHELYQQLDRRFALITQFVTDQANGTLTDEKAKELAAKWFAVQDDRMALWKKYYGQIEQALSPIRAAQFVQVENQVALMIDLAIASEMPYVGATGQTSTQPAAR